ncbi:MAG TPA: sodium-translocating pyrophosphatase [Candidatus Avoscillospira stercorigallinarum]|uniref:Putative K(+)-stimulated pyrophosphate-energized sodium pump n=1 Tax=Candidatus Avoscillospira stercorigallinarum TaxID=2840708 RepID=A0A9D0Z5A6_9FIRM|nr:sodium-translocating pyrophosphatase [Candidatus Avoscillospira stercorigallinarum]
MQLMIVILVFAAGLALAYAAFNFFAVKKLPEGNERMQEIASAIRVGANAFLDYEYRVLYLVIVLVAVVLAVVTMWQAAVALLIGALMSGCAGLVGMKIATYANVRVSNRARETQNIGATVKVAFRGGSVMGLCVGGFALLGLFVTYVVFGLWMGQLRVTDASYVNFLGLSFIPFPMTLSGYALGCSIVAMFNRVGGGIYTKAADMGADLVGKTEAHIPEDDPRNPATIADNVGDNVGDVAGLGSDLLESYVGAISSGIILTYHMFLQSGALGTGMTEKILEKCILFPLLFVSIGMIACCVGIASLLAKKRLSEDPRRELNGATYVAAGLTILLGLLSSWLLFRDEDAAVLKASLGFTAGSLSPWIAAAIGVVSGVVIGMLAELYTSADYQPTRRLAQAAEEGAALTITQGLALGMRSCMVTCIVLAAGIVTSHAVSGMYGVSMAAMGMLSFVTATVSVDTYGPISDNAGGIAEMSGLEPRVRQITDTLDAVGNTTAAIGKGFAIGSGALAALSLMISYLYSFNEVGTDLILNMMTPMVLAGAIVGGALPFLFSGMLIDAVAKAARKMVSEVRRQFRERPGILDGTEKPDYKTCVSISYQGALAEMKLPSLLSIVVPVGTGFLFGPSFVGGLIIGSTLVAIMLAIFCGNAGGAWDNGKKYIETGGIPGAGKGSEAHSAAVVGDTVGDPLKDTVGPCLDIFIKIMSTVSLVASPVFAQYNLVSFLSRLFS